MRGFLPTLPYSAFLAAFLAAMAAAICSGVILAAFLGFLA